MVNRYPTEIYIRFLQIIALAAIVALAWTLADNEKSSAKICMVNQPGGIQVSECAPKAETTIEPVPGE